MRAAINQKILNFLNHWNFLTKTWQKTATTDQFFIEIQTLNTEKATAKNLNMKSAHEKA